MSEQLKPTPDYSAAIDQLEISLEFIETNEPINRHEGNVEQADLERDNAISFRAAIAKLKGEN